MFTDNQISDIIDLLIQYPDSKVYIGSDSVRFLKGNMMYARYAVILVIHKNGNKGCRIFSYTTDDKDYDLKENKPVLRMMKETQLACELYVELAPILDGFDVEIHLDIATDPAQGSYCAMRQATGYVLGMTGIEPKLKPESFVASFGADAVAHGRSLH